MATIIALGKERLEKLIAFVDTLELEPEQFNLRSWENECGTTCCAWGWSPAVFPDRIERIHSELSFIIDGKATRHPKGIETFFQLPPVNFYEDGNLIDCLFYGSRFSDDIGGIHSPTPQQWAERARRILALLEVV